MLRQLGPLLHEHLGTAVEVAPVMWFAHDNRTETGFVSYTYRRIELCDAMAATPHDRERCLKPIAGDLHLPTCDGRGIARFTRGSSDDLPRLTGTFDLGSSVCRSQLITFELRDVDADGEPELVVEVRWAEQIWVIVGPAPDKLGPDLAVEGERTVFLHTDLGVQLDLVVSLIPRNAEASSLDRDYHTGRYELRDTDGDGHPDVVVESTPHPEGATHTRILRYDPAGDRWIPPAPGPPSTGSGRTVPFP